MSASTRSSPAHAHTAIWFIALGLTLWFGCSRQTTSTATSPRPTTSSGRTPGAGRTPAQTPDASQRPNSQRKDRFENMSLDVKYVGNQSCVDCHAEQHQTYELTAHRHALAEVDLATEPAPGSFLHPISGRSYDIVHDREHQKLIHRENLIGKPANDLNKEHAVRYVIGSGHHSRSYLMEVDGFLIESPITWYASQSKYAMSPGYDRQAHGSFERMADMNCLICHAGEVSAAGGNSFKPIVHQQTIGCESCHGPGGVHVTRHREKATGNSQEDPSIVNPRRLSRAESESLCANCHLRGVAAVMLPGKSISSFRPGMLLQDCRVDYHLAESDGSMTVVGHVEQMHLSACYVKSETLTCTTCHDPHSSIPPSQRKQATIDKCVECHSAGCAAPADSRLAKVPDNNCVTCHMPQSPTDIPHFAFTHHRIGHHRPSSSSTPATNSEKAGNLVPIYRAGLSPALERRNLGLAYFEYAEFQQSPRIGQQYLARAESLLLETYNSPLRDPEVESALARLSWDRQDYGNALQLAQSAVQNPAVSSRARLNSLFIIGESSMQLQDYARAAKTLEMLVKDRRIYADWLLLTLCYSRTGQLDEAARCLKEAIKINAFRREAHEMIIEVYKRQNKTDLVQKHTEYLKR